MICRFVSGFFRARAQSNDDNPKSRKRQPGGIRSDTVGCGRDIAPRETKNKGSHADEGEDAPAVRAWAGTGGQGRSGE
jgi:hypothetical protein